MGKTIEELQKRLNDSYLLNVKEYEDKRLEIIVNDIIYCIESAKNKGHNHLGYLLDFHRWTLNEDEINYLCNKIIDLLYTAGYDCEIVNNEYLRVDFVKKEKSSNYLLDKLNKYFD